MVPQYIPGVPVETTSISVSGSSRTQQSFFNKELSEAAEAKTIDAMHSALQRAVDRLKGYGIFDAVHAEISVDDSDLAHNKYRADVRVQVKEKRVATLKLESYVKAGTTAVGDVGMEAQGALRNPFGFGETARVSVNRTSVGSEEYSLSVSAPFPAPFLRDMTASIRSAQDNLSLYTGFVQQQSAFSVSSTLNNLDLQRVLGAPLLSYQHKLQYTFSLRDEVPLAQSSNPRISAAPEAILLRASSSSKSSLKYTCTRDTRNKGANSTAGELLELEVEAALPPGSSRFLKSDLRAELHRCLGPSLFGEDGLAVSVSGTLGVLHPLGAPSRLSDRFYMGGPMSLRGFGMLGCGPRAGSGTSSFPIGGNSKASLMVSLHCPIPLRAMATSGCRSFVFMNCGSVGGGSASSSAFGFPRLSVGLGGSFALGPARLECTYSLPLIHAEQDQLKQVQIGAGLTLV